MEEVKFNLFVENENKFEERCDGCNKIIPKKESYISGIRNLGGTGLHHCLCKKCIEIAFSLLKE